MFRTCHPLHSTVYIIAAFQTKHYLWAAFKAKEDKGAVTVEQEEDKEKHVSGQLDDVQPEESDQEMVLMKCAKPLENQQLPANSIQEGETCLVQGPPICTLNVKLRDSSHSHQAVSTRACTADATTVANAATVPSEATLFATNTVSLPANHGPNNPSMEAGPCSSSVLVIVVRQNPKVQQIVQEMERDGILVAVMEGGAIGAGQWPSNMSAAARQ